MQLERQIASLSSSTDNSDIAERQRLEEQLFEAKQGLNDTYYSHSKDSQADALDRENEAYQESMSNYIETLRQTLDTAKLNMDLFLQGITTSVMANADTIQGKFESTGIAMDEALLTPWKNAAKEIEKFGGAEGALSLMNAWTSEGGFFPTFNTNATKHLKEPWSAGKTAMKDFKTNVGTTMTNIVKTIKTNVASAKQELNSLYKQIKDTPTKVSSGSSGGSSSGGSGGSGSGSSSTSGNNYKTFNTADVKMLQRILKNVFKASISETGKYDNPTKSAVKSMQNTLKNAGANVSSDGLYGAGTQAALQKYVNDNIRQSQQNPAARKSWFNGNAVSFFRNRSSYIPSKMYAQGTLGTKRDELAITDEIGDELVLVPGKNGNLSFMRKGTGVVPADLTKRLFNLAQMPDNELMRQNVVNAIVPNVSNNTQAIAINFEALVKAEHIDNDIMGDLEKMVSKQLNAFTKQLNYAIKRN